jgi:hypothetical protein
MGLYIYEYKGRCVVEADSLDDVTFDDLFSGDCVAYEIEMTDVKQATEFDVKLIMADYTDN